MKTYKLILLYALLAMWGVKANADNVITTNEVVIRPGGTTELTVSLQNDEDFNVYAYDFRLYLPEGVEVVKDEGDNYTAVLGARNANHNLVIMATTDGGTLFGINHPNLYLTGTEGPVLGIKLKVSNELVQGTTLQGSIKTITYANKEAQTVHPTDVTFDIKVQDKVVLDESALMLPDGTSGNVDILVKRTIKANEWSTLCLPFAMSVEKLKAAFGDDYQLAYLTGYDTEKEGDEVIAINVKFTERTGAALINRPYIIKVSKDITEFEVNAKITPEDKYKTEITVEDDETGEDMFICSMTGNLKSGTIVPTNSLFLSGNKFWYSKGKTPMKAFRAYFTLNDILSEVATAGARILMSIDGKTTAIDGMKKEENDGSVYDLLGRQVRNQDSSDGKLPKGLYISKGKKVVIH